MKTKTCLIFTLGLLFMFEFYSCSEEKDTVYIPVGRMNLDSVSFDHSMKGWELYSWPNGSDWNYSILPGTNITKTYESVTENSCIVFGKDSLKMLLDKFPEQEHIFWIGEGWLERCWGGNYGNISLPDERIIREIRDYCAERNLILMIDE